MKLIFLSPAQLKFLPKSLKAMVGKDVNMQDKSRAFKNIYERAQSAKSMMKDHTPSRLKSRSGKAARLNQIRNAVKPYSDSAKQAAIAWLLVAVQTKVSSGMSGQSNDTPEEFKMKLYEAPPQMIYKAEAGVKYTSKFEIDHGEPNKYMRAANNLYGKESRWLRMPPGASDGVTEAYINRLYSQCGANRQGFMTGGLLRESPSLISQLTWESWRIFNYYGLPSTGMMINEFIRNGMTSDLFNAMFNRSNQSAQDFAANFMVDLRTNINSRFSIHSFFNSNKYSDANIKVYVCQSKLRYSTKPWWFSICSWGNTGINPVNETGLIPKLGKIVKEGYEGPGSGVNWFDAILGYIRYIESSTLATIVEVSSVLGMTPQQSQQFKDNWEVLDVLDCTIGPNDTWDLHVEEKFNKGFSTRQWLADFNEFAKGPEGVYSDGFHGTAKGDVVLIPVFSGNPSPSYVMGLPNTPTTPNTETVMPIDAAPCRIRHLVRHGINISWPESIIPPEDFSSSGGSGPTDYVADQGWVTVNERTNYTARETHAYGVGEIRVMSSEESRTGGAKVDNS